MGAQGNASLTLFTPSPFFAFLQRDRRAASSVRDVSDVEEILRCKVHWEWGCSGSIQNGSENRQPNDSSLQRDDDFQGRLRIPLAYYLLVATWMIHGRPRRCLFFFVKSQNISLATLALLVCLDKIVSSRLLIGLLVHKSTLYA